MHALIVFLIFIAIVSVLVFKINKERNQITKLGKELKDDSITPEARQYAQQELKKLNKQVLTKSIVIVVLIILFYVLI